MGRTVPTVRQLLNEEYHEWIKMGKMLPLEERKALIQNAAINRNFLEPYTGNLKY
jgi:hypothetical protein